METPMTDFEELAWASSQFLAGKLSLGIYTFVHLVISLFFFSGQVLFGETRWLQEVQKCIHSGDHSSSSRSAC